MAELGDIYQIRFWSSAGAQAAVNVRHYRVGTVNGGGATDGQVASRFSTVFAAAFKACFSAQATFRGVQAQRVWPRPPLQAAFDISAAGVGGVAGDMVPAQVSGIIKLLTQYAGRKYRGRMYVPWVGESDNAAGGVPTSGYLTRLVTLADLMFAPVLVTGEGDFNMLPIIPVKELIDPGPPKKYQLQGGYNVVLDSLARDIFATQRRRGSFGRPNTSPI